MVWRRGHGSCPLDTRRFGEGSEPDAAAELLPPATGEFVAAAVGKISVRPAFGVHARPDQRLQRLHTATNRYHARFVGGHPLTFLTRQAYQSDLDTPTVVNGG